MEVADGQAGKELTRAQLVALWAGRALFFLPIALFVAFWAWYFVAVLRAGQYSWAFWSLLLFSLFLFTTAISPRRQASRVELALATAKLLVEYEAPRGAEDIIEKIKAAIPEEARKAVEKAKPQLIEEATRAFTILSERAATIAVATTSTFPTSGIPSSGALRHTWSDFPFRPVDDPAAMKAVIDKAIRGMKLTPVGPGTVISDGDRVRLGDKAGTVRKVMSDGRSRVEWDDGTSSVEDSGKLTEQ